MAKKAKILPDGDVRIDVKRHRERSRITEHGEQHAVFEWAKYRQGAYPELEWMFAIPNVRVEPHRRMYLSQEGVKAGVSDICLPVARGRFHGLFIEMKRDRRSKVQETQRKFLAFVLSQGYYGKICYGADEAISEIEAYLNSGEYDEDHKFERIK